VPRYILTGTPGAGKTAILRQLEFSARVVEEAATDVIALAQAMGVTEPWTDPAFIDTVLALQQRRQSAVADDGLTFFDRSPVCTLALSRYADVEPSPALLAEVDRLVATGFYERTVFFIRNQGYVAPTPARRITLPESLRFEQIHEDTYRKYGFRLVDVPARSLTDRVAVIRHEIA
jgi:predicted ATPase